MSTSTSGIHFSGVASGLDIDSIVNSLMTIEGLPIQRMQTNQTQLQSQQAALASFRSQVQSVGAAIAGLAQKSTYNPVSATSSDTSVASVTAGSNAGA
ncbi:MAG: flagellar cap protein FliD N-terminal domain-containing protein, partial [Armatimonadota bacterium]